jgi:hypothetical protein
MTTTYITDEETKNKIAKLQNKIKKLEKEIKEKRGLEKIIAEDSKRAKNMRYNERPEKLKSIITNKLDEMKSYSHDRPHPDSSPPTKRPIFIKKE